MMDDGWTFKHPISDLRSSSSPQTPLEKRLGFFFEDIWQYSISPIERTSSNTPPNKRKYSSPYYTPEKRLRFSPLSPLTDSDTSEVAPPDPDPALRTFPPQIPIDPEFPLFYRRFPRPSSSSRAGGTANPPRDPHDLYTPRRVKGAGRTKTGLCPVCVEGGRRVWLAMKFSAFNYHMQYTHGISAASARPFSPPIAFRTTIRSAPAKGERENIREGHCHKCTRWVPLEGIKDVQVKVKEIFWWKHAAACHQGSTMPGECDIFIDDGEYIADGDDDENLSEEE